MIKKMFSIILLLLSASISLADYQSDIQEVLEESKAKGYSEGEQQTAVAVYQCNEGYFDEALETLSRADSLGIPQKYIIPYYFLYTEVYKQLGKYKKALEYSEKILTNKNYNLGYSYYPMEIDNLYFKFKLGKNIEDEKNDFLAKWEVENEIQQYALCDFFLLIEDYQSALSAIKDYDKMLIDLNLTETNVQYILFTHAYYELGDYKKAKEYYHKALTIDTNDNTESYLYYWDTLINYKLGNMKEAINSFKIGQTLCWDFHGRFILNQFWRFSEKNIKILEEVEKLADHEVIGKQRK